LSVVFAGLAFFLVFIEKELHMRTKLDTEFGLEEKKEKKVDSGEEKAEKAVEIKS
jgi:hypothetical protein